MGQSMFVRVSIGAALALGLVFFLGIVSTASEEKVLTASDDCDPTTFNAAVGPGTCVGSGTTTFAEFIAELTKHQSAPLWRYTPLESDVPAGKTLQIHNRGGETHTFTKVAKFGGGFVPPLNVLSGNPTPAPECAIRLPNGDLAPQAPSATNIFVEAGETDPGPAAGSSILPAGQEVNFQCCIHPWMRVKIRVP